MQDLAILEVKIIAQYATGSTEGE